MSNYIVLDLEWNQSAAGRDSSMDRLPFEIFEIGAVKLDPQLKQISEFRRLIKPRVYKQLHYKILEVTHVSMNTLDTQGRRFEDVVGEFLEWCGDDYTFCTWGSMDLTELQRNMVYHGLDIPFDMPFLYYDIQKLYSLLHGDEKTKEALDHAVQYFSLNEDRPFHRALDDAYYTGRVMATMDFNSVSDYVSLDYYRLPETAEEEIYMEFPSYSKFVSRIFETKEEALSQKNVTDMVCYKCHRTLRKKLRWFSSNQKTYFALGHCPEHGFMKGKIRVKRGEDGYIYIVKTSKLIDEESSNILLQKKEEIKEKRTIKNRLKRKKN